MTRRKKIQTRTTGVRSNLIRKKSINLKIKRKNFMILILVYTPENGIMDEDQS